LVFVALKSRSVSVLPVLFLIFWVILNSRLTVEVVAIGIVVSFFMSIFTYRLIGLSFQKEWQVWTKHGVHLFSYFALLLRDIVRSTFQMVRIVLSPKIEIHPQIVYFNTPVEWSFSKVLLLYSIMLTPGTVMFELEDGRVGIHAIDPSMAENINDSVFIHKLRKIEGGQPRV